MGRTQTAAGKFCFWICQAHEGLPLVGPDGQQVKKFHAYGQQWADMARGSGHETVVHKAPLLRYAALVFSRALLIAHAAVLC